MPEKHCAREVVPDIRSMAAMAHDHRAASIDTVPIWRSNLRCALICALVSLIAPSFAVAQAASGATEFWFAPPDVTDLNNAPGGEPIYLMLASSNSASTVTIDLPANGSFTPIVRNLAANDSARVNLTAFKASLETRPTNTIDNTGLHITATTPVTAYYEVANSNNSDMWTLKGPDAMGQEFFIPLHKHAPFSNEASYASPHQAFASFDIVASQNGTSVTMYSPTPVDGHPALTQFTVTLNRGQTYSAAFTGTNWQIPSNHPSGAAVIADKPIAVSLKDDSVHNPSGGCTSLMGDQLVPVSALGSDYIAIKGLVNNTGDESVVITATQNATQVFLDGSATPAVTLFAGEYYRVDMDYLAAGPNTAVYIHASKPIYAVHVSGLGCKTGMALLPRLTLAGSQRVDFVRENSETFYLMLLAPTSAVSSFAITGAGTATINPASFVSVPGTGGAWSAARIQYNTTQVPLDTHFQVTNSSASFALGMLSAGSSTAARYGYLSDFAVAIGFQVTTVAVPNVRPEPGGSVSFSVHVVNSGDVSATLNILMDNVQGNLAGQGTCALPQTIAAGAFYDCSFTDAVDGNAGDVQTRSVTASGTSLATAISASGSATVTTTDVLPTLTVANSANPTAVVASGGSVTFSVRVTNTDSAEDVMLMSLVDDLHGSLNGQGDCVTPQVISIGGFYQCSYSAIVTGSIGAQTNTLTAGIEDDELNNASAQATATVAIGDRIFANDFE
jgi:IgGFc binding protein